MAAPAMSVPAQHARATELSQLTSQQLIDRILALESAAAPHTAVAAAAHVTPQPLTALAANNESTSPPTSRKHKRPHSEQSTSAKLQQPANGNAPPDANSTQTAALTPAASSTSHQPSPSSPIPPPTKHQRLSKQARKTTNASPSAATPPTTGSRSAAAAAAGFDYWSYPVRHIALRFLYLGTPFYGFSSQPSSTLPTVESHLFQALLAARLIVSRTSCHYQRCGRTDRGVHAGGQLVSLWLRSRLKPRDDGRVPVGWVGEGKKRREREREERRARGEVIHIRHLEDARDTDDDNDDTDSKQQQSSTDDEGEGDDDEEADEEDSKEGGDQGQRSTAARSIDTDSIEWEKTEFDYVAMLNRHLPTTIRVLSYHPVPLPFSARFSCHRRTYHYLFYRDGLDIDRMRTAGSLLCGKHDFRNFCTYDVTAVTHFIRRIHRVDILPESEAAAASGTAAAVAVADGASGGSGGGSELEEVVRRNAMWRVEVEGKGFLYHQVRCMVSVLFAIGRHEEPVELIPRLLDIGQTPHKPAYRMASEKGLILQHSRYDEFDDAAGWPTTAHSTVNLVRCYTTLFQQQRQLAMEAAVVGHMAAAVHTSLLRLAQHGRLDHERPSGLLSQLPFQLSDRPNKRWLCGGELLREANLQRSFAERVQSLTGKRRERRQRVERLREEWRRKEGDAEDSGSGDGEECEHKMDTDATLPDMETNGKAVS